MAPPAELTWHPVHCCHALQSSRVTLLSLNKTSQPSDGPEEPVAPKEATTQGQAAETPAEAQAKAQATPAPAPQPAPAVSASMLGVDAESFDRLFPFSFTMDMECRVLQAGAALKRMIPAMAQPGTHIGKVFEVSRLGQGWQGSRLPRTWPVMVGSLAHTSKVQGARCWR